MPTTDKSSGTTYPSKKSSKRTRTRYTQEQRDLVAKYYSTCDTPEAKEWLCEIANIPDIRRLYNLSCQMGLTRYGEDLSDAEFGQYMAGNHDVLKARRRFSQEDEGRMLRTRQDPRDHRLTAEDEKFLIANFGRMKLADIALSRGQTETALMYCARHLQRPEPGPDGVLGLPQPLRRPAHGFPLSRVTAWLGIEEAELPAIQSTGVEIRPLPNRRMETIEQWVLASSLAPFLRSYGVRLIEEKDADAFFIKEILETEEELIAGNTEREECYFVDHGHRCQNPWAGPCHGLSCDGNDAKCRVKDLRW